MPASPTSQESTSRFGPGARTIALSALGLAIVLLLSVLLEPAPQGYGTHTQLALPPCGLRAWTGIPCPGCGVTTAVVLTGRGRLLAAFETQPMGPLLVLAVIVLGLSAVVARRRGVDLDPWLWTAPSARWMPWLAGVIGISWLWAIAHA